MIRILQSAFAELQNRPLSVLMPALCICWDADPLSVYLLSCRSAVCVDASTVYMLRYRSVVCVFAELQISCLCWCQHCVFAELQIRPLSLMMPAWCRLPSSRSAVRPAWCTCWTADPLSVLMPALTQQYHSTCCTYGLTRCAELPLFIQWAIPRLCQVRLLRCRSPFWPALRHHIVCSTFAAVNRYHVQHRKAQLVYSRVAALPAPSEEYPTTVKNCVCEAVAGNDSRTAWGQTTVCKVCCFLCLSTLYSTTDPITMLAPTRKELKHNEMQRYYTA